MQQIANPDAGRAVWRAETDRKYKNRLEAKTRNTLSNKHLFKKRKPLTRCKRALIGAEGLEQDAKDPQKQGLFDNADNTGTQFGTHLNYFEQILTLFDQLDADEHKQIITMMAERLQQRSTASN